jgi:hypothetical protein
MANRSSVILAFVAGPIVIGAAYSISSLLTAGDATGETANTEMSLAYGLLLWVGTPLAIVALLPLFGGILKIFKKP